MIASIGEAVDTAVADATPIVELNAPTPLPVLTPYVDPGLPPELQPEPGSILLSKAFWPWDDLGAKLLPEQWLYMSRRIQGVIAQLAVQTPNGPKLLRADKTGAIIAGTAPTQLGQNVSAFPNSTANSNVSLDPGAYGLIIDVLAGANLTNITITDLDNGRIVFNSQPTGTVYLILPYGATIHLQLSVTAGAGGTNAVVAFYEAFFPLPPKLLALDTANADIKPGGSTLASAGTLLLAAKSDHIHLLGPQLFSGELIGPWPATASFTPTGASLFVLLAKISADVIKQTVVGFSTLIGSLAGTEFGRAATYADTFGVHYKSLDIEGGLGVGSGAVTLKLDISQVNGACTSDANNRARWSVWAFPVSN